MLSKDEMITVLSEAERMKPAEKPVEAIIGSSRRKKETCEELAEIESDIVRQPLASA